MRQSYQNTLLYQTRRPSLPRFPAGAVFLNAPKGCLSLHSSSEFLTAIIHLTLLGLAPCRVSGQPSHLWKPFGTGPEGAHTQSTLIQYVDDLFIAGLTLKASREDTIKRGYWVSRKGPDQPYSSKILGFIISEGKKMLNPAKPENSCKGSLV